MTQMDSVANLSARVSKLERQFSSLSIRHILEQIESQDRGLESLRLEVYKLKELLGSSQTTEKTVLSVEQSTPKPSPSPTTIAETPKPSPSPTTIAETPKPSPSSQQEKLVKKIDFPLKEENSLEGIISYLTKKHGGNVHAKGIVTITSKSVDDDPKLAPKNVAELTSESGFMSKDEPGQWICWDFHEMRVRPTHYTIGSWSKPKSWVVEGSLDGENWTEIHRTTNHRSGGTVISFTVSKSVESRFIRLTQTDENSDDCDYLSLTAVEFFGTLSE
jgi:regulator of replication initiation timing